MIDDNELKKSNFIKAKYFYDNKISVHLMKTDREWFNGFIVEFSNDFFIIDDRKYGRRMVFFIELWSIEEMIEEDNK